MEITVKSVFSETNRDFMKLAKNRVIWLLFFAGAIVAAVSEWLPHRFGKSVKEGAPITIAPGFYMDKMEFGVDNAIFILFSGIATLIFVVQFSYMYRIKNNGGERPFEDLAWKFLRVILNYMILIGALIGFSLLMWGFEKIGVLKWLGWLPVLLAIPLVIYFCVRLSFCMLIAIFEEGWKSIAKSWELTENMAWNVAVILGVIGLTWLPYCFFSSGIKIDPIMGIKPEKIIDVIVYAVTSLYSSAAFLNLYLKLKEYYIVSMQIRGKLKGFYHEEHEVREGKENLNERIYRQV
jgi:hypothetical protein